jgi:hypothetical protein
MLWAPSVSEEPWDVLWTGNLLEGTNVVRVPEREGGVWLLRLIDLPGDGEGRYAAEIAMVRFLP